MKPHKSLETDSFSIITKRNRQIQGLNTGSDFLEKSDILLEHSNDSASIAYLENKVMSLQNSRDFLKNILEEEIFKLRQTYISLKLSLQTFVRRVMEESKRTVLELQSYLSTSVMNNNLEKVIYQMKTKINDIQLSNKTLQQDNNKMLDELQTLKRSFNVRNCPGSPLFPYNNKQENNFYQIQQANNRQTRTIQYESTSANQSRDKIRKHDSQEGLHMRTTTQYYYRSPTPSVKDEIFSNIPSPIKNRQSQTSFSKFDYDQDKIINQYKDHKGNHIFNRSKYETQQSRRSRLITRKPGTNNSSYKRHRQSINFQQIQSRINNIKQQLKLQIRSVEKRKF